MTVTPSHIKQFRAEPSHPSQLALEPLRTVTFTVTQQHFTVTHPPF